jgi:carbon-monoxide dehydrogenase small subunit
MERTVSVEVNGRRYERAVEPRLLLVHFLRDVLGLTGTNVGCQTSLCGACTVLIDGRAVKSCTKLAVQADGRSVTTVEGLAGDGRLHPLQEAFRDQRALQCGYCTPGFLLVAEALLRDNPAPSRLQVAEALSGNLCRCTGYLKIFEAVELAAERIRGRRVARV